MHRGVQILRDKQDIIEAHAQLAKLQTSKALVEKERMPGVGSTDSLGLKHHEDSSSTVSQMPGSQSSLSQVQSVAAPSLISQSPPVALQSSGMPQYQSSNVQSQQLVPTQHMPQEGSGHALQQVSTVQIPPEQIHYKGKSQLPSVQIMPSPQQPILQTHQSLEQGHYLPTLPHVQMQQPSNQQSVHLIPHQQTEQMQYQPAPQQMQVQLPSQPQSVQQPVQAQLGTMSQQQLQPQQGMITQQPVQVHQPPHLQQQPGSRFQGSLQYYGQTNDGQSYATANPSSSAYTQGMYVSETVHDSPNYSANQRQVAASPTHQPSQLPPIHGFHQMSLAPNNQLPQDTPVVGNISAPSAWNRQANLAAPVGVARLPAVQPVRAEHPPEGSGIVDKVASMGFSRDQVQSVIRKLAERNQAIDMNVVLDILMNGSRGTQGGFAR
ncbi:hypothetical protein KP509_23G080900 [Ceratopteris richardii]|nr:hypothetical protein KP509_23G080900 [Ceratopteris richardii]